MTFEKANVVHMGDLMFHRRHPRVDRPAGASIKNWATLLSQVIKDHAGDTIYIFGHSKTGLPVTGPAKDLQTFASYLTAVLEHTQKGIKAGQSKDEIAKTESLSGFDDYMGAPPMLTLAEVLKTAYDELTSKS